MSTETLEERVRQQLDEVVDPCSAATQFPQSIVDLGLVDGVDIEGGDVTVHLLPTNQLCMYVAHMIDDIETRVGELADVESIRVEQVTDKIWTQDRMTNDAYEQRQNHFQKRVEEHDLTPAYDGEQWVDGVDTGSAARDE